jgi:hypothetical protein
MSHKLFRAHYFQATFIADFRDEHDRNARRAEWLYYNLGA